MKPRLSIDARSIAWSSASSTAFRVALDLLAVELHEGSGAGRLDFDGGLRRLYDTYGLPCRHPGAVLDEPLREKRVLGVCVLAREDDLEH